MPKKRNERNNKMKYNPQIHHRRSIRLKGYDYSQAGLYFVTICCDDRKHRFGKIDVGAGLTPAQMKLNEFGMVAYNEWAKLRERFPNFELDVFQIMPNHMHGIIVLNDIVVAGFTPAQNDGDNLNMEPQTKGQSQGLTLQNILWMIIGRPQGSALPLVTLLAHTNRWLQMVV